MRTKPLDVKCPTCHAEVGDLCVAAKDISLYFIRGHHFDRGDLAYALGAFK